MRFGLSGPQWAEVEKLVVYPLKRLGSRVYVFGSRARGDHREFSDLDLLIESETPLPLGTLGMIREALEESSLPVHVDLVEWGSVAASYRDGVLRDRVEV